MDSDNKNLPTDTQELQKMVGDYQLNNSKLEDKNSQLEDKLKWYEEQFALLKNKRFGQSSEKQDGQMNLFNEAELILDEMDNSADEENKETITYTRNKPGRKPLPKDLPREIIRHELPESEQVCECGHHLHVIEEVSSEQVEIIPAQIKVIEHVQVKYGCRGCEQGVITAPKPPQAIPRSITTASMLAYIIVSKFADSLPLYRQEAIFKRLKIYISRANMSNWMLKVSELLNPYYQRLQYHLCLEQMIQADETTLRVIHDGRDNNPKSYMWVYQSGAYVTPHPIVLYEYQPTRAGQHAKDFLDTFTGYLQTDGFPGYHIFNTQENTIKLVGCMAHARRKFDDALKALPKDKRKKAGMVQTAISKIARLYGIEKQIKKLEPKQRYLIRLEKSKPILDELKVWCDKTVAKTMKDSLIGKAIRYMINQWDYLVCYLEDGLLQIDNNAAERSVKPFVIGRKNWLFSQTPRGAKSSAILYSLVQTSKANNLEPFAFLSYLLTEIPKLGRHYQPEELDQFMPWNLTEKIQLLNKPA